MALSRMEFGHIYNGDMKISLRLAAMVMALYIYLVPWTQNSPILLPF